MRIAGVLLATLALAGCSLGGDDDGDAGSIERPELSGVVLQPDDLPNVFVQFDEGRQVTVDAPRGARSDPARFGRVEGWKARYRRPGSASTAGPLVIESRADLFESADGAKEELTAFGEEGYSELDAPQLGDEARAFQTSQGALASDVSYYLIAWREDNVTASLLVSGFARRIGLEDALDLARKQQQRLAAAAA